MTMIAGQRGYPYDDLERGARFALTEQEHQYVCFFFASVGEIIRGRAMKTAICQRDAFSEQNENVRDLVVHMLGLLFEFDLDHELSCNERPAIATVEPWQKSILGLCEPANSLTIMGTERTVCFGLIPARRSIAIMEFEFPSVTLLADGVTNNMMRTLTCTPLPIPQI